MSTAVAEPIGTTESDVARLAAGAETDLASALYVGRVRHRRHADRPHAFSFRLFLAYLDLDELPTLLDRHPLWSARRPATLGFRAADYFDGTHDDPATLADAIRDLVADRVGVRPAGPVRLLTHVRTFGWLFNPLSVWYCFHADGDLAAVVAEVTNTPWRQRHWYVVRADGDRKVTRTMDKAMPVSPFLPMDLVYRLSFRPPAERIWVRLEDLRRDDGQCVFDADLVLRRVPMTVSSMVTVPLRHPALTLRISASIHRHAALLFLKGATFYRHPESAPRRRSIRRAPTRRESLTEQGAPE